MTSDCRSEDNTGSASPLAAVLQAAREHVEGLLNRYAAAESSEEAGVVVKLTIRDLSRLDHAREEVLRPCLAGLG